MGASLRRSAGRKLAFVSASAVAGLGAAAMTAQAASPVTQVTVPIQSVQGPGAVDPCNGQPITWTGDVHAVGVMTTDANGGAVFVAHVNFADVKGTDPTGTRYTITLASNDNVVFAPSTPTLPTPNVETHTLRLNINSNNGSPNYYEDEVLHYTVTPDGTVTVAFDNVDTGCSS